MFTSAPQSALLQRNAFPLPHGSVGKGQAISVHTGAVAVAAACCGRPNHANAAASTLPSETAAMAAPAILLIATPLLVGLVAGEVLLRRRDLWPFRIGIRRQRHELLIVVSRRGLVTEHVGCLGGAGIALEAVRLLGLGGLESHKPLLGQAAIEQHEAVKLARRRQRAWCDRMLFGLVLGVGCNAHGLQSLVIFALRVKHPGNGHLTLDIDDLRPVIILGSAQLVAQFCELLDVGLGGFRLSGTGGAESAREM